MSAEHGKDGIRDIQTALKTAGEKLGVRFNARDAQGSINRVLHAGEVRGVKDAGNASEHSTGNCYG
ncbi:MAG: hypothetical protein UT06_C0035G0003 [Candidatus Woesebacteria bacterium GW2011_GWA1_38_8]|uniref:Uncharacterized protein n=1 Tax=Candidatus Woesebacteria bacterium GW2011_GWA1_38_8 TaxID=1618547 RepID=A0A0G0NA92_9BACT|nr:MAG: hypothetical protein UT06_C0035G0003 [Candidatus Woesebacteria bacterium GW2011_GWA1_38_8]